MKRIYMTLYNALVCLDSKWQEPKAKYDDEGNPVSFSCNKSNPLITGLAMYFYNKTK